MVRLPSCDYDILLLAFIFSILKPACKNTIHTADVFLWELAKRKKKTELMTANCEFLGAFKNVLFHCIHLSRNNMEEEIQQYAIHSRNILCFLKKCLVSEKGATWQSERDQAPAVAEVALCVRRRSFPRPRLPFPSRNPEAAIFTLPWPGQSNLINTQKMFPCYLKMT